MTESTFQLGSPAFTLANFLTKDETQATGFLYLYSDSDAICSDGHRTVIVTKDNIQGVLSKIASEKPTLVPRSVLAELMKGTWPKSGRSIELTSKSVKYMDSDEEAFFLEREDSKLGCDEFDPFDPPAYFNVMLKQLFSIWKENEESAPSPGFASFPPQHIKEIGDYAKKSGAEEVTFKPSDGWRPNRFEFKAKDRNVFILIMPTKETK